MKVKEVRDAISGTTKIHLHVENLSTNEKFTKVFDYASYLYELGEIPVLHMNASDKDKLEIWAYAYLGENYKCES